MRVTCRWFGPRPKRCAVGHEIVMLGDPLAPWCPVLCARCGTTGEVVP